MSKSAVSVSSRWSEAAQTKMLEGFGFLFQILGVFGLGWALLVLYILIKNGHLKSNVAYIPAAGLALANVGQLILLVCHLAPALYDFSIHGSPDDPCDGVFIILWYGSLGNVLVMAISRCWVTLRPTYAKHVFTLRRMVFFSGCGFFLGCCVAALPYMNVCCHFAFQISSKVIDNKTPETVLPLLQQATNASIETLLSVNFSVVVPKTDNEYLTIIKTNNVLLLTHVIDFCTVFISIVCYGLVFYKVRRHGNKISAQQQQNQGPAHDRSPHSSQVASGPSGSRRRHRGADKAGGSGIEALPGMEQQNHEPPHRVAIRHQPRGHHGTHSRQITSTSDVRMLRRISTHFCLMSSAVMFFSVILLVVHRYPTEPALVLLHQLFYVLTATVNSFLISTLNEKIRGDFRKCLHRIRMACCPVPPPAQSSQADAALASSSTHGGCWTRLCKCTCRRHIHATGVNAETGEETTRRTTQQTAAARANTTSGSGGGGNVLATFDLTQRIHA